MARTRHPVLRVVVAVLLVGVGAVAFDVLYWLPRNEDLATERAKVATPVGTATFTEVLRDPDRYVGQVLTLEGIVDDLRASAHSATDPIDTTVYPPSGPLPGTIIEAAYYPGSHPWTDRDLLDPRSLVLTFLEPVRVDVHEGNTVRVVCRIVGERGTGFLETALDADVCRDLSVLDDSTYEWSEELRYASEVMRRLAQDSILIVGEARRSHFEVDADWSLEAVTAFCEGSQTAVGHDSGQSYIPIDLASIDALDALWSGRGLQTRRVIGAGDVTAGMHATLLEGVIESIGTITLRIEDDRYSLIYETECL